jgi:hypothetical protein
MRYRDYLPESDTSGEPLPTPAPAELPRPGHGVVWVNGGDQFSWSASWQEGPRIQNSPDGTREQAMSWAREFPAPKRVVFAADRQNYVEFD